ncbi:MULTISPECIES: LytR/AlgR family response regulator transcription factor [Maribacter]|uniref:DNA-binding response regulator, LytR/AlgR family n=2 Tax=Maribacter dokdonensis TaxID=320912 RepID=A0ABY0UKS9_9FLAO|nr:MULTISPECIES: LytTR family DNA-binding domain-containing protein [Maribacter]APA65327.1 LytR family transcriptional regulator [Maribacter sp. 1_2014MBL_MicDiv]KSA14496.1 Two-component system response regulator [Maribacter dokdonensis DSW-8]MBU2899595.1 LytTR family DNA-binding domain-containing protein [Maribacter dokdonensis]SDS82750.1 DNA-binding response regulator, LytR/AlgR family [Maribacter dokdonensis]
MNCIIIDDEAMARAIVRQLCSKIPDLDVIEEFDNAISAIKFLNQQTIDVIFLDIHMPGFSGVDFVQTLKDPPKIVLTTSDTDFAIAAYEYESIVDYLVKPITQERFEKCIDKISSLPAHKPMQTVAPGKEKEEGEDLYINIDRRLIKLKLNEILVIEAKGDYIDVKTEKEDYRVHTTLKKIKEKLPERLFLQIHRSYIINFTKIIDIEDNSVLIAKNVVPISRSNRPELMRRLNLL